MNTSPSTNRDPLTVVTRKPRAHFGEAEAVTPEVPPETAEKPEQVIMEMIQAPYKFTIEETVGMDRDLRGELQIIDTLTDQKKQSAQDFKLRIDAAHNRVKQLRNKLDTGTETRPLEAIVKFDTKRSKKLFSNPETGEFVREDDMTPADWQLPMFRKEEIDTTATREPLAQLPEPAEKPKKSGKAPAQSPSGATNLGDVLTREVAGSDAPLIDFSLSDEGEWTQSTVLRAFKKAAMKAGWTDVQISVFHDRLREAGTVEKMLDTIRPHVAVKAESAAPEQA